MAAEPARRLWMPESRWLSGVELLLGAAIVIGHNVYRVVPNEVPILFVLGLASSRLRNGGFAALGFRRPESWPRVLGIAAVAAAVRLLLGEYVIDPLTARVWPPAKAPAGVEEITGDVGMALLYLGLVWTFAAVGEEVSYRGYLTTRTADVGRGAPAAWWAATIVVAVLFGYGHYYKGPAGIVDSGIAGLILGAAYLLSGRVLWTSILAHGFIDTFGVLALFMGWDS